ncbi:unnamed protein product [Urochloa humidicola]
MVSDASKKKAAQKKAAAAAKRGAKAPAAPSSTSSKKGPAPNSIDAVAALKLSDRTCTGVLASHPLSRDIHVSIPHPPCLPRRLKFSTTSTPIG